MLLAEMGGVSVKGGIIKRDRWFYDWQQGSIGLIITTRSSDINNLILKDLVVVISSNNQIAEIADAEYILNFGVGMNHFILVMVITLQVNRFTVNTIFCSLGREGLTQLLSG